MLRVYLLILSVSIILVLCFAALLTPVVWPFTVDSSSYIYAAVNLLSGRGFSVIPHNKLIPYTSDFVPLTHFPPGYPLLIAGVSAFNLDPPGAAVWIARVSWMLLPLAFIFLLRKLIGTTFSVIIGFLAVTSPGVLIHGFKAVSDVPFLLFALLSLAALLHSFGNKFSPAFLAASGLLAGMAFSVRYVGMSLILAVPAAFVVSVLMRIMPARKAILKCACWALGLAPILIPLLGRNAVLFGKPVPYPLQVHLFDIGHNIQVFLFSIVFDITTRWSIAQLAWNSLFAAAFSISAMLALFLGLRKRWQALSPLAQFAIIIFALYTLLGAGAAVLSQTKTDFKENNLRYCLQYTWLVCALPAFAIPAEWRRRNIFFSTALFILTGLLFLGRIDYIRDYSRIKPQLKRVLAVDKQLIKTVSDLPDDAFVVSNYGHFLSIESKRPVRTLPLSTVRKLPDFLDRIYNIGKFIVPRRPVYVVILPIKNLSGKNSIMPVGELERVSSGRFEMLERTSHMLLLRLRERCVN